MKPKSEENPLYKYDKNGILNKNHKPSRGRARKKQLLKMSQQEIDAEKEALKNKNRLIAIKCRIKKKNYMSLIEIEIKELKEKQKLLEEYIEKLETGNNYQENIIQKLQEYGSYLLHKNQEQ